MTRLRVDRIVAVVGIVLMASIPLDCYLAESASSPSSSFTAEQAGFMDHIDHIVFVVLENHAYDNYFGTYCPNASPACPQVASGIPPGTCVPYDPTAFFGPCIRPWPYSEKNWSVDAPLPHDYASSHAAWNHGLMNGFYLAEDSGLDPFGYYNGSTAPIYWDLAQEYALSDNFFSSILSYSLPNHWHMVAGQAPETAIYDCLRGCPGYLGAAAVERAHLYLDEANQTPSIEDLLIHSSVSWKTYDFGLGSYDKAISLELNTTSQLIDSTGVAFDLWNPEASKAESYGNSFKDHFVERAQFYWDARNGTLPSLSWVLPAGQDSDHPPNNSTTAQTWLASIVDAVEASPDWNTTAVYITWDDYGGFYDNVAPPSFFGMQLGFRVPLLVISPYTQAGTVSNSFGFFESVLALMEWRFNLGCLTVLDCNAPLPLYGFDWNQAPRVPILFPTDFSQASYPFNPHWNGTTAVPVGAYIPPTNYTFFPEGEEPDID